MKKPQKDIGMPSNRPQAPRAADLMARPAGPLSTSSSVGTTPAAESGLPGRPRRGQGKGSHGIHSVVGVAALCFWSFLGLGVPTNAAAQQGELFEQPFVVEHYMVHIDETGERYEAPSVVDTYGGSWIVSERADHSRLVVDLARSEITEIRPLDGTYWTVGFERLNQLMKRVAELEGTRPENPEATPQKSSAAKLGPADWRIEEGKVTAAQTAKVHTQAASLMSAEGVRHLKLSPSSAGAAKSGAGEPTTEIWADPKVKLEPAARQAMARFERDALGTQGAMEAAREYVDGAFPIRTKRLETKSDGSRGQVEDVVLRLDKIESFDRALVRIPEGLRRVPHPLEGLAAFLERENQRQRMMSGEGGDSDGYGGGLN